MKAPSLNVRAKLLCVVGLMGTVAVGLAAVGWNRMSSINEQLEFVVDYSATRQQLAGAIRQQMTEIVRGEKNFILADTDSERDRHAQAIAEADTAIRSLLADLGKVASEDDQGLIDGFVESYEAFLVVNKRIQQLSRQDSDGQAFRLSETDGRQAVSKLEADLQALAERSEARFRELAAAPREANFETIEDLAGQFASAHEANRQTNRLLYDVVSIIRAEKNFMLANTDQDMDKFDAQTDDLMKQVFERNQKLSELLSPEDNERLTQAMAEFTTWMEINKRIRALSREATGAQAEVLSGTEARDRFNAAAEAMEEVMASADRGMDEDVASANATFRTAVTTLMVSAAIGIVAGVGLALLIINQIVSALTKTIARMRDIAAGKLNQADLEVKGKDELATLATVANEMQRDLRALVTDVIENATQVAAASTEVSATSEQLARSVDEQRAQLSQVSAAVEELSTSISEVSTRSQDVSSRSSQAGRDANEGGKVVSDTVDQINAIATHIEATGRSVSELSVKAEQIGQILTVINDIADQTNLLALNAAIEAARAGEHGRGFAVVADEVRKLAERTTEATQEVANSITEIRTGTNAATDGMVSSQEKLARGVELAQTAGQSLKQIVHGSQDVATSVDSIAAAVEEQSAATGEIASSIERTTASTSEASEAAGEAAAAATQLSANAERLRSIVQKFQV